MMKEEKAKKGRRKEKIKREEKEELGRNRGLINLVSFEENTVRMNKGREENKRRMKNKKKSLKILERSNRGREYQRRYINGEK